MKRITIFVFLFTLAIAGFGQSETSNYITKDTLLNWPENAWAVHACPVRIIRPAAGEKRPTVFFLEGQGEQRPVAELSKTITSGDVTRLTTWGPASLIAKGWDGGVPLGNGTHYPVHIAISNWTPNGFDAGTLDWLLTALIKQYPSIDTNNMYLTGLSQGAMVSAAYVGGNYRWSKKIRAIACLSGAAPGTGNSFTPFAAYAKAGGRAFFSVHPGDANAQNPPIVAQTMNAAVPGSAFFTYSSALGAGGANHCCWNTEYDPKFNQFWNGPHTATGTYANTQGTYKPGSNLYQWMLRQGDTALVGVTAPPPVIIPANKYPVPALASVQPITAPTGWVILDGSASYDPDGTVDSATVSQVSGPTATTIIFDPCNMKGVAVGLVPGTYVFMLRVVDNKGAGSQVLVSVVVNPVPVTVVASIPLSFTILGVVISKTIIVKSDGSYSIQ